MTFRYYVDDSTIWYYGVELNNACPDSATSIAAPTFLPALIFATALNRDRGLLTHYWIAVCGLFAAPKSPHFPYSKPGLYF